MEFKARLTDAADLGGGVRSFRFERPRDLDFKPGQFMKVIFEGAGFRYFSFSSADFETDFFEFTTKDTGSDFKKGLFSMDVGEEAAFEAPMGAFLFEQEQGPQAFVAGGIGITPFLSILKSQDGRMDGQVLFYGVNSQEDVFCEKLLSQLSKGCGLKVVYCIDSEFETRNPHCYRGYVTGEVFENELENPVDYHYMVCGPPVMVASVKEELEALSVDDSHIMFENFSGCG